MLAKAIAICFLMVLAYFLIPWMLLENSFWLDIVDELSIGNNRFLLQTRPVATIVFALSLLPLAIGSPLWMILSLFFQVPTILIAATWAPERVIMIFVAINIIVLLILAFIFEIIGLTRAFVTIMRKIHRNPAMNLPEPVLEYHVVAPNLVNTQENTNTVLENPITIKHPPIGGPYHDLYEPEIQRLQRVEDRINAPRKYVDIDHSDQNSEDETQQNAQIFQVKPLKSDLSHRKPCKPKK